LHLTPASDPCIHHPTMSSTATAENLPLPLPLLHESLSQIQQQISSLQLSLQSQFQAQILAQIKPVLQKMLAPIYASIRQIKRAVFPPSSKVKFASSPLERPKLSSPLTSILKGTVRVPQVGVAPAPQVSVSSIPQVGVAPAPQASVSPAPSSPPPPKPPNIPSRIDIVIKESSGSLQSHSVKDWVDLLMGVFGRQVFISKFTSSLISASLVSRPPPLSDLSDPEPDLVHLWNNKKTKKKLFSSFSRISII